MPLLRLLLITALAGGPGLAQTSDQKLWALAASAFLAERAGYHHDLLEMIERTPENTGRMRTSIEQSWNFTNREQLLDTLDWLEWEGHRRSFIQLSSMDESTAAADAKSQARAAIARGNGPKTGSRSIVAFDFVRYLYLCRVGYHAAKYTPEKNNWKYYIQTLDLSGPAPVLDFSYSFPARKR